MAGVAIVAAVPDDIAETHKGIVQLFSSTDDQRSVRESGQAIAALDESTKARHLEMQQSIKGVLAAWPAQHAAARTRPSRPKRPPLIPCVHLPQS